MKNNASGIVSFLAGVAATGMVACAGLSAPAIFSDNMMLQRGAEVPVFGQADPGAVVKVALMSGESAEAVAAAESKADGQGHWMARLDTSKLPNETYQLRIENGDKTLRVKNVLIGQVWLASGQSNMEWAVANVNHRDAEIADANYPEIRHFIVEKAISPTPTGELRGHWDVTTPQTAGRFTAVGYFFARYLHKELKVPVGIIHSSWGGTVAEAWTSEEGLRPLGDFNANLDAFTKAPNADAAAEYQRKLIEWQAGFPADPGDAKAEHKYTEVGFDDGDWKTLQLPQKIEAVAGDVDGIFWFRTTVALDQADGEAELSLGPIDDFDHTYINGVEVGGIGKENPEAYSVPRIYKIPAGTLKKGTNAIAVRVFDHGGDGGLTGAPAQMKLTVGGKEHPLAGEWRYKIEHKLANWDFPAHAGRRPAAPGGNQNSPTALFNAMLNPIVPYAIAGAIWYQGESNVGRDGQYVRLLSAMIEDWRSHWDQKTAGTLGKEAGRDFPFYIVQLANFMPISTSPGNSDGFARLRQAQTKVANTVKNAGQSITIDIGEANDIHPRNKQEVGKRLARVALAKTYGKEVEYAGPTLESAKAEGDRVMLAYSHVTGGFKSKVIAVDDKTPEAVRGALAAMDGEIKGFAVRDAEGAWHYASAEIVDDHTIALSAGEVERPTAARYAFADNPLANLCNGKDLPAEPFEVEVGK